MAPARLEMSKSGPRALGSEIQANFCTKTSQPKVFNKFVFQPYNEFRQNAKTLGSECEFLKQFSEPSVFDIFIAKNNTRPNLQKLETA